MTRYGKCSRKRGSEAWHETAHLQDIKGFSLRSTHWENKQTLTDLWVWGHFQFDLCENSLKADLSLHAGNLSSLTFLSRQQWLNGFCSSANSFTYFPIILLSGFLDFSSINCPASLPCSSGRASRCPRALRELLTRLVVSSWLEMFTTNKMLGGWGGGLSEVTTLWTATFLS